MFHKKRFLNIVLVAILALCFLFQIYTENRVDAAEYDPVTNSESDFHIPNMTVTMKGGVITIVARSKKATHDIEYDIIGFGISKTRQDKEVTCRIGDTTYTGPAAVNNIGIIPITKPISTTEDSQGYDISTFVISSKDVNNILAGELKNITNDTTIYLNAIFRTVSNNDGKKTIRKPKIESWHDIMTAEYWGTDSLEGFSKFYNLELKFCPGKQPNSLYFIYNGSKHYVKELDELFINSKLKWNKSSIPLDFPDNGKSYEITGYEVKPKLEGQYIQGITEMDVSKTVTKEDIINGSAIVPLGGLNVYIKYKEVVPEDYPNTLYYEYKSNSKKVTDLKKAKPGAKITWSTEVNNNKPETILGKGKYKILGYYIKPKDSKQKLSGVTSKYIGVDKNVTETQIINGTALVVKGGLNVTIVYGEEGTVLPSPTPTPSEEEPIDIPEGGYVNMPLQEMEAVGEIRADKRNAERFDVLQGIPTTESLYTQVVATKYALGYTFEKRVVVEEYSILATKPYTLSWSDAKSKKSKSETVSISQTVTIKRACAYWEISYLDYYTLDKTVLYNGALPNGTVTMYPNGEYYSAPVLSSTHSSSKSQHMKPPSAVTSGVMLSGESISGGTSMPGIPSEDFTREADGLVGQIQVRNDYLSFDGSVIMNNNYYDKETPDLQNLDVLEAPSGDTGENVFYKPNQIIPAKIKNNIYSSSGVITYKNHPSAVASSGSTREFQIDGLNSVTVHTPVICDASIVTANSSTDIASNDKYVQTLKVDSDYVQLVLDSDSRLSDFTVDIDNYGTHKDIPGYYTRDFAWCLRDPNVSYIAKKNDMYRNEVKFPFDVYWRKSSGEDEFINKNTWIRFGHNTPTFYLPMWVDEGIYDVDFRTIAVNGDAEEAQLTKTEVYANYNRNNYVATDQIKVQVSGRIYGLTIYDVSDYPTWEKVFRTVSGSTALKLNEGYTSGVDKKKYSDSYSYDYKVGTNDQYGNKTDRLGTYTFPLVNGSHPKYKNIGILKKGYAVRFKMNVTGNAFSSNDCISIKPRFYYVDDEGKNRTEVDLYYTEYFNGKSNKLVKMGGKLDKLNIKDYSCGDLYLSIPKRELELMADIYKTSYNKYIRKETNLFTYTNIRMGLPLMSYVNIDYLKGIKNSSQYDKIHNSGISDVDIVKRMQTFYGEYYIPADTKAVKKDFDVLGYASKYGIKDNSKFWLDEGGYIIIRFDIVTKDSEGNENLSYLNLKNAEKGYCSMWKMENPVEDKVSYNGPNKPSTSFSFKPGDFLVYDTDKSVKDDYDTYMIK